MNIILFNKEEVNEAKVVLSAKDRRAEHISSVLKMTDGDTVKIGIINGFCGEGVIHCSSKKSIEIKVKTLATPPPAPIPITLILAMQRPKTMKKILQSAAAMGVKQFYIIETWKVEKSYWSSPLLSSDCLKKQLLLGLEQAGDTMIPEICIRRRFKPFVEDELSGILANYSSAFIAHPYAPLTCPSSVDGNLLIAIGPEGGFTEYEVDKMQKKGMQPVNIGTRPLRSEFAVTALLSRVMKI